MGDILDQDITNNHLINISGRKSINITEVKKIENFDEKEFLINTSMGFILINGSNLEIIKLDTFEGNLSIKGKIDSLTYLDSSKKNKKTDGIFNKLFKWFH